MSRPLRLTFVFVVALALAGTTLVVVQRSRKSPIDLSECQAFALLPCEDQAARIEVPVGGTAVAFVYRSDRAPGRTIAPADDVASQHLGGWTLDVHHSYDPKSRILLQGDGTRRLVQALPIRSGRYDGDLAIAAMDGMQVFVFDSAGHHLWTLDAISGAILWQFLYDETGRLTKLVDQGGQAIIVQRDASGRLTGVLRPDQSRIAISLNTDGDIASITQPSGATEEFTYAHGRLVSLYRDARGLTTSYSYDERGLLTSMIQPGGATTTYVRTAVPGGKAITITSPAGRKWTYTESRSGDTITRSIADPVGGRDQVTVTRDTRELSLSDGASVLLRLRPDPRFGMQAPVIEQRTTTLPGGQRQVAVERRRVRVVSDPLVGVAVEDSLTIDGATSSINYDHSTRTVSNVDADGVRCSSTLDDNGRATRLACRGQVAQVSYDERGRLSSITETESGVQRKLTISRNDSTGETKFTDPLGHITVVSADASARLIALTLPDGNMLRLTRDAAGNVLGVQPPGAGQFLLTSSPQGLLTAMIGPSSGANGAEGTWFDYDADGLLQRVTAGTAAPATLERDLLGRLTAIHLGSERLTATYQGSSPVPVTLAGPGGVTVARTVNGPLVTSESWRGPVTGTVARSYDAQQRVTGVNIGGTTLAMNYDPAGHVANIGGLMLAYDSHSGRISREGLGGLQTIHTYDSFGDLAELSTSVVGNTLDRTRLMHDAGGHITSVKETGVRPDRLVTYRYDVNGRLAAASEGSTTITYDYEPNGDLVSIAGPNGKQQFRYDAGGRLIAAGTTEFNYGPNGALATRRTQAGVTSYLYDQRGALQAVILPTGRCIDYVTDAIGRRIGTMVDGKLTRAYLWAGNQVVAELDGSSKVVSRFGYDGNGDLAIMLRGGSTYRVLTDPNGSVREVIDEGGKIVERIDYDAWGKVVTDTNPGFQPFGFAGGLADPDTGLVRLGARDYDPTVGRFTAPDPIGFAGGQTNLYAYANDDPLNGRDRTGLGDSLLMGGVTLNVSGIAPVGVSWGVNIQYIERAGLNVYLFGGGGSGADTGLSVQGNLGILHNPSSDPAQDWAGATDSYNFAVGPTAGSYYESPNYPSSWGEGPPSDPYYSGASFGVGMGSPAGASRTQTYSVCMTCPGSRTPLAYPGSPGDPGIWWNFIPPFGDPADDGEGASSGEPHIYTPNGLHFDEQAAGEFLALISPQRDLEVQVRQQPASANVPVTFNTAFAMNVNGDRVGVYRDSANGTVLIRGKRVDRTPASMHLPHGGRVVLGSNAVLVRWPDGSEISVMPGYGSSLTAMYMLSPARRGAVAGVWGAFTGDPTKDLTTRQGTVESLSNDGRASRRFVDSWRIKQAESLFEDMPGKDVTHFANLAFDMQPATIAGLLPGARQRAAAICSAAGVAGPSLDDCILDVGATGNPAFAIVAALVSASRPSTVDQYAINIGDTVSPDRPAPGAGIITHVGQKQTYSFVARSGEAVYLGIGSCEGASPSFEIRKPDNKRLELQIGCHDLGRVTLPDAGTYRIVASADGTTARYNFFLHTVPPDQHFSVRLPFTVSPDVPAPGAGRITAQGAQQFYDFTADPGTTVHIEGKCDGANLDIRATSVGDAGRFGYLGLFYLRFDWRLPVGGKYTVQVRSNGYTGNYSFTASQPAPQQR